MEPNDPKPHQRSVVSRTTAQTAANLVPADWQAETAFSLPLDTSIAPSFPGVFRTGLRSAQTVLSGPPELTESDGQFEVVRELGRGASGVVYLARQIALNRRVALKVTYNVGKEALTMANLEHPNVVQVFSETVSNDATLRLICMQYVAGITLADLIRRLKEFEFAEISGWTILELIAEEIGMAVPETDVDVRFLKRQNYVEAVCQLGTKLASGLEHAHRQAVIHRDIKPANILINREGQPLLADFSLSMVSLGGEQQEEHLFGGTLPYMAPEHLDALRPASGIARESVDQRSDLYSLGLVLQEMFSLADPSLPLDRQQSLSQQCAELADWRRRQSPALEGSQAGVANALNWTLARCLQPDPKDRFQQAGELTQSLYGCEQLAGVVKSLPPGGRWTTLMESYPVVVPFVLGALPNLLLIIGAVAFLFSTPRLAFDLSPAGRQALFYCFVAQIFIGTMVMANVVMETLRQTMPKGRPKGLPATDARAVRQRLLRFQRVFLLAELSVFLVGLAIVASVYLTYNHSIPRSPEFYTEFSLMMLLAMTLSYFVVVFATIRVGYPYLWDDPRDVHQVAAIELPATLARVRFFHMLAGAVPLVAAVGLVLMGEDRFETGGYFTFRAIAIGLIASGLVGWLAMGIARTKIERTIHLFIGDATQTRP